MKLYRVLEGLSIEHIDHEVKTFLADGWSLQGGVNVVIDRHYDSTGYVVIDYHFFQAVTKPQTPL